MSALLVDFALRLLDVLAVLTVAGLVAIVGALALTTFAEARWLDDHRSIRETPEPQRVRLLDGGDE